MLNVVNYQNRLPEMLNQVQHDKTRQVPAFGSLKPQIRQLEKIVKEHVSDLGPTFSTARLAVRIETLNKSHPPGFSTRLWDSLTSIHNKLYFKFYDTQCFDVFNKVDDNRLKEAARGFRKLIKSTGLANDTEHMHILNDTLTIKGFQPRKARLRVENLDGEIVCQHFNLIGLSKGADVTDPTTWGSKAIVVDGWNRTVKPAREALNDLLNQLSCGSKISFADVKEAKPRQTDLFPVIRSPHKLTRPEGQEWWTSGLLSRRSKSLKPHLNKQVCTD